MERSHDNLLHSKYTELLSVLYNRIKLLEMKCDTGQSQLMTDFLCEYLKGSEIYVLEICAGNGRLAEKLKQKINITATDIDGNDQNNVIAMDAEEAVKKISHNVLLAHHPMPMFEWSSEPISAQFLTRAILQETDMNPSGRIMIIFNECDVSIAIQEKGFLEFMEKNKWFVTLEAKCSENFLLVFEKGTNQKAYKEIDLTKLPKL